MSWLERRWQATYEPARAYLLLRGIYLLLAGDLWLEMVEHGARYGIGAFNVAHFGFVDRWLPPPTPSLYVGLLIASGALSLLLALGPTPRWLRLSLAATYTSSWVLSMHDSYQHHYLLSWVLVFCAACPDPSRLCLARGARVRGWGLPMIATTCAIVYGFTGLSKAEPEWRSGYVLRELTHSRPIGHPHPGKFDGLRDVLLRLGITDAEAWSAIAWATIALQAVIALGYLTVPHRDERPSRARGLVVSVALLGALSFHAIAEVFEVFEIGIFSYYMIWMALVLLGPAWLVGLCAEGLAWAGGRLACLISRPLAHGAPWTAFASAGVLGASGLLVPLPGAASATAVVAIVLGLWTLLVHGDGARGRHGAIARCGLLTALALWAALTQTAVPFDYYRRGAGELQRMGLLDDALAMYRLAERYAPTGESRRQRIRELERLLEHRRRRE